MKKTEPKTVRLNTELIIKIQELAKEQNRNFSNMVETLLQEQLTIHSVVSTLKNKEVMDFDAWFKVHGYYHNDTMWLKESSIEGLEQVYLEYKKYVNRNH